VYNDTPYFLYRMGRLRAFRCSIFFPFFPRGTWTKKKRKGGKKDEIAGSRLLFVTNFWGRWEWGMGRAFVCYTMADERVSSIESNAYCIL